MKYLEFIFKDLKRHFWIISFNVVFITLTLVIVTFYARALQMEIDHHKLQNTYLTSETMGFNTTKIETNIDKFNHLKEELSKIIQNQKGIIATYTQPSFDIYDSEILMVFGDLSLLNLPDFVSKTQIALYTNPQASIVKEIKVGSTTFKSKGILNFNFNPSAYFYTQAKPTFYLLLPQEKPSKWASLHDDNSLESLITNTKISTNHPETLEAFNEINDIYYHFKPQILPTAQIMPLFTVLVLSLIVSVLMNAWIWIGLLSKIEKEYTVHMIYGAPKRDIIFRVLLIALIPLIISAIGYRLNPLIQSLLSVQDISLGITISYSLLGLMALFYIVYLIRGVNRLNLSTSLRKENA